MITQIQMVNFRRHASSTVRFDDSLLVLIEGANGVGKSTVLEAVLWALYGESRDGKAALDALVRRGGEDEGMQVEVVFERGGREYVVTRSRRRGQSKARMTVDGVELARAPSSVTSEVSRLFGMDSAGFRLAVYAQQKELDALASLQPARRAAMIGRLLGLDAVAAAKGDAAASARQLRSTLEALGPDTSEDDRVALEQAEDERASADMATKRLGAELAVVREQLSDLAEDEMEYEKLSRIVLGAAGAAEQLKERISKLEESLSVEPPTVQPLPEDVEQLEREVSRWSARRESLRKELELHEQLPQLVSDRDNLLKALEDTIEARDAAEAAAALVPETEKELSRSTAAAQSTRAQLDRLSGELEVMWHKLQDARVKQEASANLAETCDSCGQSVDAAHREELAADRLRFLSEMQSAVEETSEKHAALVKEHESYVTLRDSQKDRLNALLSKAGQAAELSARESDLLARIRQVDDNIQRRPSAKPDVEACEASLKAAEESLAKARKIEAANMKAQSALDLRRLREIELGEAREELSRLDATRIPEPLMRSHLVHADLSSQMERLTQRLHEAEKLSAVSAEKVRYARTALARSQERSRERAEVADRAVRASSAAKVLSEVADVLAAKVRPMLESEVSQLLDRLSEGRYTQVRFDEEFNCTVEDDGGYQPLSSLSGGEVDLVALAVRLALGGILADRAGSDGPEFLVLDECFGSQDESRQRAIVDALRHLDDTYKQVIVISHVPGVKDGVDRIVRIDDEVSDIGRVARTV